MSADGRIYAAIRGTNVRVEDKLLAEQLIKFLETVDVNLSCVRSLCTRFNRLAILIDDAGHRPPLSSNRDPAYTIKVPHGVMYGPRR